MRGRRDAYLRLKSRGCVVEDANMRLYGKNLDAIINPEVFLSLLSPLFPSFFVYERQGQGV